jgi:ectoine hydroxylase-related dioxygenase (phytanoyl-CoA dioxygenase family)
MIFEPTAGLDKKSTALTAARRAADPQLSARLDEIAERGFCIIKDAFSSEQVQLTKTQLAPWLQGKLMGRNNFEGESSERVYALLAKAPVIADMVTHPDVLDIVDALLSPHYLLSAALAINVHPGETSQPFHVDDNEGAMVLPKPRVALGVSAIWALDDFTTTNGATEVVPGSHLWADDREPQQHEIEQVIMPAGSALVFAGSLIHRGGANVSASSRLAVTPQYCMPWLRQIENMVLAVPPSMAQQYSDRVRELLGYSIVEPGFMGYVDGRHPRVLIPND